MAMRKYCNYPQGRLLTTDYTDSVALLGVTEKSVV